MKRHELCASLRRIRWMCRDDVWCWGVSEEKIPTYSISRNRCFQDESFGSTSDTETKPGKFALGLSVDMENEQFIFFSLRKHFYSLPTELRLWLVDF